MLQLNKYLREIGYSEKSFPFKKENISYYPDGDGFVPAEFYSLDSTLAMQIYSYLSYFRDNCADRVTPGRYIGNFIDDDEAHKEWLSDLEKIIYGYKLYAATEEYQLKMLNRNYDSLTVEDYSIIEKEMKKSNELLIKIFGQLGW